MYDSEGGRLDRGWLGCFGFDVNSCFVQNADNILSIADR